MREMVREGAIEEVALPEIGFVFPFDVERLEPCPPCSSSRNPSSEPTPEATIFAVTKRNVG
jgi:hypothetical protein